MAQAEREGSRRSRHHVSDLESESASSSNKVDEDFLAKIDI